MNHKQNRRKLVGMISKMTGNFLLCLILLICIPLTVPKIFGYEPYSIVSGSMAPSIPTGSLVYIRETEVAEIESGDVIAYYGGREEDTVVVHRVLEKTKDSFITKGDANATEDLKPVAHERLLGVVSLSVPKLGVIAQAMTIGEGRIAAAAAVILSLILHLLAMFLEHKQEK